MTSFRTKLIRISSENRKVGESHSKFTADLGNEQELHSVKRITLSSVVFQHNMYNVNNNNNVFEYKINGVVQTPLVVPIGNYTTTTLISDLVAQDATLIITQSVLTGKLTVAVGAGTVQILTSGTLADVLGFLSDSATAISVTADGTPDLQGVDLLFVKSRVLAQSNLICSTKLEHSVLATIPNDTSFGFNIVYNEPNIGEVNHIVYNHPKNVHVVDIEITDERHRSIVLQRPVVLVLKAYF
jgi:hypothetical protein